MAEDLKMNKITFTLNWRVKMSNTTYAFQIA